MMDNVTAAKAANIVAVSGGCNEAGLSQIAAKEKCGAPRVIQCCFYRLVAGNNAEEGGRMGLYRYSLSCWRMTHEATSESKGVGETV